MRVIIPLFLFLSAIPEVYTQGTAVDTSPRKFQTPDALGRHLFQAIKTGDYKQAANASALALTSKDMKHIGQDLIKIVEQKIKAGDYENPADGQAVIQGIRDTFLNEDEIKRQFAKLKQEEKKFKKSFNQVHDMDQTHGFDWQKTKYLRTDSAQIKKDRMVPLTVGDLFIHFKSANQEFRINLPNCANPPHLGWLTDSDPLSLEPVKKTK